MFNYEEKLSFKAKVTRPDAKYYLLLDQELGGCATGLKQAQVYIRQAFMIHNVEFHKIYMQLGTRLLNDMEVLASILHQMHGVDDRYYDESNDDTPAFEYILPRKEKQNEEEQQHVNNDLSASVLRDIAYEKERLKIYEKIERIMDDAGTKEALTYLKESAQDALQTLENLLHILTTHTETKDFGLGNSHNAFDLDTSNYFDKPNPIFINPSEMEDLNQK